MTDDDLDELTTTQVHEHEMATSPEYRAEYERTRFAADVAGLVIKYRSDHRLTQRALGELLGMHQTAVARIEAGEHEPSIATLRKLADVLGISVEIAPARLVVRAAAT